MFIGIFPSNVCTLMCIFIIFMISIKMKRCLVSLKGVQVLQVNLRRIFVILKGNRLQILFNELFFSNRNPTPQVIFMIFLSIPRRKSYRWIWKLNWVLVNFETKLHCWTFCVFDNIKAFQLVEICSSVLSDGI